MKMTAEMGRVRIRRPVLEGYQTSTLHYVPPGTFPAAYARRIGKPQLMRCMITLDEVWASRTGEVVWDYPIGTSRYRLDARHAPYDWAETEPSPYGVRYLEYITSHAAACEEMILCYRRYEREVIQGMIAMATYEHVLEEVIGHYKELCPNIVYIEQFEPNSPDSGDMNAFEYYQFYRVMVRVVNRLNQRNAYDKPLKCAGPCIARAEESLAWYQQFLQLYAVDTDPDKRLDAYSVGESCTDLEAIRRFYDRHCEMLQKLGLPEGPVFLSASGAADSMTYASAMLRLMMASISMKHLLIFPCTSFDHPVRRRAQTQYLWDGREDYIAAPGGAAMEMLHMMPAWWVKLGGDAQDRAIAATDRRKICILAVNDSSRSEPAEVTISGLTSHEGRLTVYLCDQEHNNCFTQEPIRRLLPEREQLLEVQDQKVTFTVMLAPHAFALMTVS